MICLKRKIGYLIFLIIVCFAIIIIFNKNFLKKENIKFKEIPDRTFRREPIKDIFYNKVIIIGDSRMEFLNDRGDSIRIPSNFDFIALSGTTINWFENDALKKLNLKLKNMDKNYQYHVVINMGVNDLNDTDEAVEHADDYFILLQELVSKYDNVNFYFLSVNPINDRIINRYFRPQHRTTSKILSFNSEIVSKIDRFYFNNLFYCDSYDSIDFGIPDGLHYDKDTDQKIVDYIVNDCVRY